MIKHSPFLAFLLLLSLPVCVQASHIVGGDISYKFIQRQGKKITFHFTMKMYRDVFTPTATGFDDIPRISVYLAQPTGYFFYGNYGSDEIIAAPVSKKRVLDPPTYPCLTPPSDIGVDEVTYEWDVTVADTNLSYIVTYQRCCRNGTIANIM
ncbi:MAG: hypothetical protein U5L45_23895 [Saprospiraceae bacterium]|nr:hypothetical protein [Saprospiraceae bacterium]